MTTTAVGAGVGPAFARPVSQPSPTSYRGALQWFWAAQGVELAGSDAETWRDLSGNDNDATQTTPADRPAFGIGGLAGYPYVEFDGVSDHMSLGSMSDASLSYTLYTVIDEAAIDADQMVLGTGPTHGFWTARQPAPRKVGVNDGADRLVAASVAGPQLLTWHLCQLTSTLTMYRDGVSIGSVGTGVVWSWTAPMLGRRGGSSAWHFQGRLYELALFNVDHTAGELAGMHALLLGRYGL